MIDFRDDDTTQTRTETKGKLYCFQITWMSIHLQILVVFPLRPVLLAVHTLLPLRTLKKKKKQLLEVQLRRVKSTRRHIPQLVHLILVLPNTAGDTRKKLKIQNRTKRYPKHLLVVPLHLVLHLHHLVLHPIRSLVILKRNRKSTLVLLEVQNPNLRRFVSSEVTRFDKFFYAYI